MQHVLPVEQHTGRRWYLALLGIPLDFGVKTSMFVVYSFIMTLQSLVGTKSELLPPSSDRDKVLCETSSRFFQGHYYMQAAVALCG